MKTLTNAIMCACLLALCWNLVRAYHQDAQRNAEHARNIEMLQNEKGERIKKCNDSGGRAAMGFGNTIVCIGPTGWLWEAVTQ